MSKFKEIREEKKKNNFFYMVRQNPLTSMPPSKLSLRIPLTKPYNLRLQDDYNGLQRYQWTFTMRDNRTPFSQVFPTLTKHTIFEVKLKFTRATLSRENICK